jgi:hypothetical protein
MGAVIELGTQSQDVAEGAQHELSLGQIALRDIDQDIYIWISFHDYLFWAIC